MRGAVFLLMLAGLAGQARANEIDLTPGSSITVGDDYITCEGSRLPRSWSCSITCTISGFQDASDVVQPMAGSAAASGTALNQVIQSCSSLEQTYVDAFKQQHPTWPIYITWAATCDGKAASVVNCCAQD